MFIFNVFCLVHFLMMCFFFIHNVCFFFCGVSSLSSPNNCFWNSDSRCGCLWMFGMMKGKKIQHYKLKLLVICCVVCKGADGPWHCFICLSLSLSWSLWAVCAVWCPKTGLIRRSWTALSICLQASAQRDQRQVCHMEELRQFYFVHIEWYIPDCIPLYRYVLLNEKGSYWSSPFIPDIVNQPRPVSCLVFLV